MNNIKNLNSLEEIYNYLFPEKVGKNDGFTVKIGLTGRKYRYNDEEFRLNDLVKQVQKVSQIEISDPKSNSDYQANEIIKKIKFLDRLGNTVLDQEKNCILTIVTLVQRFFGNILFNRNKILKNISKQYATALKNQPQQLPKVDNNSKVDKPVKQAGVKEQSNPKSANIVAEKPEGQKPLQGLSPGPQQPEEKNKPKSALRSRTNSSEKLLDLVSGEIGQKREDKRQPTDSVQPPTIEPDISTQAQIRRTPSSEKLSVVEEDAKKKQTEKQNQQKEGKSTELGVDTPSGEVPLTKTLSSENLVDPGLPPKRAPPNPRGHSTRLVRSDSIAALSLAPPASLPLKNQISNDGEKRRSIDGMGLEAPKAVLDAKMEQPAGMLMIEMNKALKPKEPKIQVDKSLLIYSNPARKKSKLDKFISRKNPRKDQGKKPKEVMGTFMKMQAIEAIKELALEKAAAEEEAAKKAAAEKAKLGT